MQKSLFRVVENSKFLNRLRNGHLEKSAVTGICSPSRSPKTAKTPLKVYLRLRFPNLGKPRTAGLCGRAAGACDCGLLSCAFIERVNKGRKPPKRDRIGRKNTLEKAHFSEIGVVLKRYFHTSPTNAATFASRDCGGYTRHPIPQTRTQRLTRRNRGVSDGGGITTLGAFCAVRKPCAAGCQNGVFCRFLALTGCAPEERGEPAGQRCAHARRCPDASRPRWAA